jgi:hypothetical protein
VDQAAYDQFLTAWGAIGLDPKGLPIGNCPGNYHHFIEDGGSVSTGLYYVCGKGGELRDGLGLPESFQLAIKLMLNAAHL